MTADLQPEELDALQAEETVPQPAVVVKHEGPIRTQPLPRKQGGTRTRTLTTSIPNQPLLAADHRRASFTLISPTAFLFAFTAQSAQDPSTMAAWPANVPYTCTADVALYAAAATGTAVLTIVTEYWATGD
jgi:hypothetical protein